MANLPKDPQHHASPSRLPPGFGHAVWRAGLLGNMHDAGFAIPLCTSGWEQDRFFNTRATRQKALQCMRVMVDSTESMPADVREEMPKVDWEAWSKLRPALVLATEEDEDLLWEAMHSLVPETLTALQRYRRNRPELFAYPFP